MKNFEGKARSFDRDRSFKPKKPRKWQHQDELEANVGKPIMLVFLDDQELKGKLVAADQFTIKIECKSGQPTFFKHSLGSYAFLPSGPQPAPTNHERRWTETLFVEATGCGLVPADRPGTRPPPIDAPPQADDVETRLRKLDDLRRAGVITEQEYQRKRREILDSL